MNGGTKIADALFHKEQGADSIKRCHLTSIGNPIVEIRRSYDRLISTMRFPILVRRHLYIESGPCCFYCCHYRAVTLEVIFFRRIVGSFDPHCTPLHRALSRILNIRQIYSDIEETFGSLEIKTIWFYFVENRIYHHCWMAGHLSEFISGGRQHNPAGDIKYDLSTSPCMLHRWVIKSSPGDRKHDLSSLMDGSPFECTDFRGGRQRNRTRNNAYKTPYRLWYIVCPRACHRLVSRPHKIATVFIS